MTVEYHLLDGHYDRLPSVMADLIRRVAVIASRRLYRTRQTRRVDHGHSDRTKPVGMTFIHSSSAPRRGCCSLLKRHLPNAKLLDRPRPGGGAPSSCFLVEGDAAMKRLLCKCRSAAGF